MHLFIPKIAPIYKKCNKQKVKKQIIARKELVALQDAVTGELQTAKVSIYVERDLPKYKESFTIMFQSATLAQVREIKPITAKLLMYLNCIAMYSNIIDRTQSEMAQELGYSVRQVKAGLKQLFDYKIVIKVNHPDGRRNLMQLNPYQSWKGKPLERKKELEKLGDKAQLTLFPAKELKALKVNNKFDQEN